MALSIKHNFISTKADGTDNTLLRPSNWNDNHAIKLATATLIGRQSAGTGDAEEIPCTAAAASILAAADIAAVLTLLGVSPPTTGDVQLTLKTTASAGWVMFNDGTIGDALSGASARANADCQALFTLIFNNISDTYAPILTAAGGATTRAAQSNAAAAWAAHCRISLTKVLGRALAVAGSNGTPGSRGAWGLGQTFGQETVALAANQIPSITSVVTEALGVSVTTQNWVANNSNDNTAQAVSNAGNPFGATVSNGGGFSVSKLTSIGGASGGAITSNNTGGGVHENTPPTAYLNAMVKL
ncbi:hypothetical protein [Bradyrhizobium cenepequi]